jgi:hypothetical protein
MRQTQTREIRIPALNIQVLQVKIIGDSPLVCNAWSARAKKAILDGQQKKPRQPKEAKDPDRLYQESLYRLADGTYGFPAVAFKSAAVSACRNVDGLPMTLARGAFHVLGPLVRITGNPTMRDDMVRNDNGVADIRFRAEFTEWSADLTIRYNAGVISPEQIVHLLSTAGFAVGIGEGRCEKKEMGWGFFHVAGEGE